VVAVSEIRDYLELEAQTPGGWLRRKPRATLPAILELVREWEAGGGVYNDDAERWLNERVGDLPEHERHGTENRHPLCSQLGSEIYVARCILKDERATLELEAATADGYEPLEAVALEDGARYLARFGTVYSGQDVPAFGEARAVKAVRDGDSFVLRPKGARTSYFAHVGPTLVKRT
jgi:hypothetical protein